MSRSMGHAACSAAGQQSIHHREVATGDSPRLLQIHPVTLPGPRARPAHGTEARGADERPGVWSAIMATVTRPIHAGLTADLFVIRGETFLTLERGPGRGEGVWYLPGGLVERGEDPLLAAVRETREETGLEIDDARVFRVWTYATPEGHETIHATFVGSAPMGDVTLSPEHTAFGWTTPDEYIARWCSKELDAAVPTYAGWIRQVRTNCELLREELARR